MMEPNKETLAEFYSNFANLLIQIKANKEQIQEDLFDVELPLPTGMVCDFGSGLGFTTYSLSSILRATETIGIDIDSYAVAQSCRWFEAAKLYIQFQSENTLPDDLLCDSANKLLEIRKKPNFIIGDVMSEQNTPSEISLSYCRKLLVNIKVGSYPDNLSGEDRVRLVIKNISKNMVRGGWFIAVEEISGGDFSPLLEEQGLAKINIAQSSPYKIVPLYTRYVYRKYA